MDDKKYKLTFEMTDGTTQTVDFSVPQGKTPQKGVDYYTPEDKAEIIADVIAALPAADWVDYVESDGTQYIDTGFIPGGKTKVVIDAEYVNETHSGADALFGARDGTASNFVLLRPGSSSTTMRSDYNATMDATFPAVGSNRAVYTKDRGKTYINGELVSTIADATFSSKYAMYLMAVNSQDSARFNGAVRIYSCQIYDDNKLVRDFVPWRTLSGTVGLYDRVHGKLYTDATGGTLSFGAQTGTTVSGLEQYTTEAEVQAMINEALSSFVNVAGVGM